MKKIFLLSALMLSTTVHASNSSFDMTETESNYFQGKLPNYPSFLSESSDKLILWNTYISLDINKIDTNDDITQAKKTYVEKYLEEINLGKPQCKNPQNSKLTERVISLINIHKITEQVILPLKTAYALTMSCEDRKAYYSQQVVLLYRHQSTLLHSYEQKISEHGISVLNNDSANLIFKKMICCNKFMAMLADFIK